MLASSTPPSPPSPSTPTSGPATRAFRYDPTSSAWTPSAPPSTSITKPSRPLRLATLNCLKDDAHNKDLLLHDKRFSHIFEELKALDADIVGLNEVTRTFINQAMAEAWIREGYYLSAVVGSPSCEQLSSVRGGGAFGNLLMSKLPPHSLKYIDNGSGRHSHAAQFSFGDAHKVTVCSTHLTAAPYVNEGRRKRELGHLTASLGSHDGTVVIMGDFNFHREAENASIPEGWAEIPAIVDVGTTWSFERNKMLPHYLPLWNLYNGLGLGASFGWPSEMRLDRFLIRGEIFDVANAEARLFANEPIHERARSLPALPQSGADLRVAHRKLPWEEFLFPSDHFGIVVDIPLN